ncbi:hypothetical protein IQ260_21800 [Leptolyngbya cf. ectocarpi LEGE 11479]|uniref:Uncharacterized protein n=1 Tax=Leptolyngbya cf. ectocarpi LEGE 11479 TaxID=1828722 RepID=A0A928ZXG1_LEPEC|nr:hypothetical protein [Leptolyngbya ectocarpi]MBE9069281.1 hypothetical protein [Leptolyngbya cf. ectocarpi LEGE 11479]
MRNVGHAGIWVTEAAGQELLGTVYCDRILSLLSEGDGYRQLLVALN